MSTPSFSIKNWSADDRPREKLLQKGRSALTDAELIAILIGSGSVNESAVSLSQRVLASVQNDLNALGKLSVSQLQKFKGIGQAKAVTIVAAMELARRRQDHNGTDKKLINDPRAAYRYLRPHLAELPHEELHILYLNAAKKLITSTQHSKGGITGTVFDIRLALRTALEVGATSLVLAHNHPSGNLNPSEKDKRLTQKLKDAAKALDIAVADHVIVTEDGYYSFANEGLL